MNSGSCSSLMEVGYDHHHHGHEELHVLAVDDNLIDRKLVEKLLKISSCKGSILFLQPSHFLWFVSIFFFAFCIFLVLFLFIMWYFFGKKCDVWYFFVVTTAENAIRALEYLGLGDHNQHMALTNNVRKIYRFPLDTIAIGLVGPQKSW